MNHSSYPVGCNPPLTCFECPFPDCINNGWAYTAEMAFTKAGLIERKNKKKHKSPETIKREKEYYRRYYAKRTKYRHEHHLCTICGAPLTKDDGDYHICRICRERAHLAYEVRRDKKKAAQEARQKREIQ